MTMSLIEDKTRPQLDLLCSSGQAPVDTLTDKDIEDALYQIGASRLFDDSGYGTALGIIRGCSPEKAGELLQLRPAYQRALDRKHSGMIRDAMRTGRYVSGNGATVCFSKACDLVDGQNRLCAQRDAGATLDVVVCVVPDEAFPTIDATSKMRTIRDLVAIGSHGETKLDNTVIAALVWDSSGCDVNRWLKLQRHERAQVAANHPDRELARTLYARAGRPRPSAGMLIGALVCARASGGKSNDFFRAAFSNTHVINGHESSAARALANHVFAGMKTGARLERMHGRTDAIIRDDRDRAVNAWNAHAVGRLNVRQLKGTMGGISPHPNKGGQFGP